MTAKTKTPKAKAKKPVSLIDKSFLDRTPTEDAYVEAWQAVRGLMNWAKEAEARLWTACESGDPLKYPFPYTGVDNDFLFGAHALKAERRLTKLLTMIRADAQ